MMKMMALATDAQPVSETFRLDDGHEDMAAATTTVVTASSSSSHQGQLTSTQQQQEPEALASSTTTVPTTTTAATEVAAETAAVVATEEEDATQDTPLHSNNRTQNHDENRHPNDHERRSRPRSPPPPIVVSSYSPMEMEESVLRDVLEELDRERSKRAELEDQVRKLTEEKNKILREQTKLEHHQPQMTARSAAASAAMVEAASSVNFNPPPTPKECEAQDMRKNVLSLQTQVDEYQTILEILTRGRPALVAAADATAAASTDNTHYQQTTASSLSSFDVKNEQTNDSHSNGDDSKANGNGSLSNSLRGRKLAQQKQLPPAVQSLPLHATRLLEIMPWDARAQAHIFGQDAVFEWQIYDTRERKWQSQLKYFPALFKMLPIVKPSNKSNNSKHSSGSLLSEEEHDHPSTPATSLEAQNGQKDRSAPSSLLMFLAGGDKASIAPSKHGVLTNEALTYIYNLGAGYPLPQDGGQWQWTGGWFVDTTQQNQFFVADDEDDSLNHKDTSLTDRAATHTTLPRDQQGWSYAQEAQHFMLLYASPSTSLVTLARIADNAGIEDESAKKSQPKRKFRRRTWIRQRILVDYPFASEGTKQYLKLLAENARLSAATRKISDQLVDTKSQLTEAETGLIQTKEALKLQEKEAASALEKAKKEAAAEAKARIQAESTTNDTSEAQKTTIAATNTTASISTPAKTIVDAATNATVPTTIHTISEDTLTGTEAAAATSTPAATAATTSSTTNTTGGAKIHGIEPVHQIQEFLKRDQVKEFGSKISQWVNNAGRKTSEDMTNIIVNVSRKYSEDMTSIESNDEDAGGGAQTGTAPTSPSPAESAPANSPTLKFDWKQFGRGALDRIKPNKSHNKNNDSTHGTATVATVASIDPLSNTSESDPDPIATNSKTASSSMINLEETTAEVSATG